MYGKLRVILSPKVVTTTGRKLITVAGNRSWFPVGFWYLKPDGKYYADLKSADQLYQKVTSETIALKGMGGRATQRELRAFILEYYHRTKAMRAAP